MTLSMLFWVLMLLWAVLGLSGWYRNENRTGLGLGGFVLEWVTIAILGWKLFGGILQGG